MFGKWQKRVPYPLLKIVFCLTLPWVRYIGMDRNPSAQENGAEATLYDVPDSMAVCKVSARVLQWAIIGDLDRAGVDRRSSSQVINKNKKQHLERQVKRDWSTSEHTCRPAPTWPISWRLDNVARRSHIRMGVHQKCWYESWAEYHGID